MRVGQGGWRKLEGRMTAAEHDAAPRGFLLAQHKAVAYLLFAPPRNGCSPCQVPRTQPTEHRPLPCCRHTFKHKWLVDEALTHCSWPGSGTRCYQVGCLSVLGSVEELDDAAPPPGGRASAAITCCCRADPSQ